MALDQDFLDEAATFDKKRASDLQLYEEYYSGFESSRLAAPKLTDRARRYLERSGLPFNEDFCSTVIDVFAERLTVSGFSGEDKSSEQQSAAADNVEAEGLVDLEQWWDKVWQRNLMDAKQQIVHTLALAKADCFLIVDWSEAWKMPRLVVNRPELIPHCVYSIEDPDKVEWASKVWNSSDGKQPIQRLNVYYEDRVERYFRVVNKASGETSEGAWASLGGAIPWTRKDGSPRGVPVIHFRNRPLGYDYGRSELRPIIPFADELNKQVIDLNEVMDAQGWPQRWGSGFTADSVNLKPQPGVMIHSDSAEATFGQFDPANPEPMVAAIEATLSRMARRSRTPMHLLTGGTPPSGEALKTAESGLVAKAEAAQTHFGNSWEAAMLLATKLAIDNNELGISLDEPSLVIQTEWKDPQTRNELAEAQRAEILSSLGVSKHTIFADLGLDYEQEEQWKLREKEALDEAAGQMLDAGGAMPMQPEPQAANGAPAMRAAYQVR